MRKSNRKITNSKQAEEPPSMATRLGFEPRSLVWTLLFVGVFGFALMKLWHWDTPDPNRDATANRMEQILKKERLTVATLNDPATYYQLNNRFTGFEYDLAKQFANWLDVELKIVAAHRFSDILEMVKSGEVDIGAANISVTEDRAEHLSFGPPYLQATQEVIYKAGRKRPRDVEDLKDMHVAIIEGTSYAETLAELKKSHPDLTWDTWKDNDVESLLEALVDEEIDATILDSHIYTIHKRFYPKTAEAFSISETQPIAWVMPPTGTDSLQEEIALFFQHIEQSGKLADLRAKHHSHVAAYDKINSLYFIRHIQTRLPKLQALFEHAGKETGFDWRLLAAIAYQESGWDREATSPTGVRGIMMLTQVTAGEMGVENRLDPEQSILGGARYLEWVKTRIPERISEPDRTWFALAAYNVGRGHLEDARILTESQGGNPDKWRDVAKRLPLLSNPDFYKDLRYGYARGREPVRYVSNIRSYYDILNWRTTQTSQIAMAE